MKKRLASKTRTGMKSTSGNRLQNNPRITRASPVLSTTTRRYSRNWNIDKCAHPSFASADSSRSQPLGFVRNSRAGAVPNLQFSCGGPCHHTHAPRRTSPPDNCPSHDSCETLASTHSALSLRLRWFSTDLSRSNTVLQRSNCNTSTIPLPANSGRLRSTDRKTSMVPSLEYDAVVGGGRNLPPHRWSHPSDHSNSGRPSAWTTSSSWWSILHSWLATVCPGPKFLVDYKMGVSNRRFVYPTLWYTLFPQLLAAVDRCGSSPASLSRWLRNRFRHDTSVWTLPLRSATTFCHRDWCGILLRTHHVSCGGLRLLGRDPNGIPIFRGSTHPSSSHACRLTPRFNRV